LGRRKNLVKLRASKKNGCAYHIDMHWKDARATDEREQRLYGLDAWHESTLLLAPIRRVARRASKEIGAH
jgi:AhpD family alkylhydroperoxidase